jgi:hypothetical protein
MAGIEGSIMAPALEIPQSFFTKSTISVQYVKDFVRKNGGSPSFPLVETPKHM